MMGNIVKRRGGLVDRSRKGRWIALFLASYCILPATAAPLVGSFDRKESTQNTRTTPHQQQQAETTRYNVFSRSRRRLAPPKESKTKKCFQSKAELQGALSTFRSNGNILDIRLAQAYGLPLGSWCVSPQVTDMSELFAFWEDFDQDISGWDVSSVTNMEKMFYNAKAFNQTLDTWNVGSVTNMKQMFAGASSFDQPLNSWDVSSVTDMSYMFSYYMMAPAGIECYMVGPCDADLGWQFAGASSFHQPLDNWDVSAVTNMGGMFAGTKLFNQPLDSWNVSSVTDMSGMFFSAESFNQPLDSWDVSAVTNMERMFHYAKSFNQPLGSWDVSKVSNTRSMFADAKPFNQDLCPWGTKLLSIQSSDKMFEDTLCPDQSDPVMSAAPPEPFCAASCSK